MPLGTRPNQTFEYVLTTDRELPKEKQPAFLIRFLSVGQWLDMSELSDRVFAGDKDAKKIVADMMDICSRCISGWKMQTVEGEQIQFNIALLTELLTLDELSELSMACSEQAVQVADKKKLESQPPSDSAGSAPTAPDQSSAKTDQTP